MTRCALVAPRLTAAVLSPSPAAVERVLWLAAVARALRVSTSDSAATRAAYRDLRRVIDVRGPTLYAQTPVDGSRETVWIGRAREAIEAGSPQERAAVLLWAAVGAWTDAPSGAWGALADGGEALAETLAVSGAVLRVADRLRGVMVETWREMEAGR